MARVAATGEVEAVYRQDGDRLWRSVYAFAGNEEVASDAVAEAFAQALRRGSAIRARPDEGPTLVADTDSRQPGYEQNKLVLDAIVASLVLQ